MVDSVFECLSSYRCVPGVQVREESGSVSLRSGIPFAGANYVFVRGTRLPDALPADPFQLWSLPPSDASQSGLNAEAVLPAMLVDLGDLREETGGALVVKTAEQMETWISVFETIWPWPEDALNLFRGLFAESDAWEFYLSVHDGRPVGISSCFFGSELAGLYSQGTIPTYRRRGVGTSLLRFALRRAKERGYQQCVLLASPEGFSLYRKNGFHEVFAVPVYSRS